MAFYNDKNTRHNVVISFTNSPRYDFGAFAKGYRQAANSLCKIFLAKAGFSDYEGYPIVFLYRHAFELNLKNIINWAARLCAFKNIQDIDAKLHQTHKLSPLGDMVIKILIRLFPSDPSVPNLIKSIKTFAAEYDEIDPTSFSYRYPIDKDGKESTQHHQVVNIQSIHENMEQFLQNLEVVNFALDMETDQAQEVYELLNEYSLN